MSRQRHGCSGPKSLRPRRAAGLLASALNGPDLGPEADAASGRWPEGAGRVGRATCPSVGPGHQGAKSLTHSVVKAYRYQCPLQTTSVMANPAPAQSQRFHREPREGGAVPTPRCPPVTEHTQSPLRGAHTVASEALLVGWQAPPWRGEGLQRPLWQWQGPPGSVQRPSCSPTRAWPGGTLCFLTAPWPASQLSLVKVLHSLGCGCR